MTGALLIIVSFPGPGLLLNKFAGNFNMLRFAEYSFLFITIMGAIGFAEIYHKSRKNFKSAIVILFLVMVFLSVSNDFNASDNPLVERPFYTYYLMEEETIAFNHIANITEDSAMSDYVTMRYLEFSPLASKSNLLQVDTEKMRFIRKIYQIDKPFIRSTNNGHVKFLFALNNSISYRI